MFYESNETKIKFILFLRKRGDIRGLAWTPYLDGQLEREIKTTRFETLN